MSDFYDIKAVPTKVSEILNRQNLRLRPFVFAYFPAEILERMKWDKGTKLVLSVEGDHLKIFKNETGEEFFTDELTYEIDEENFD